MIPAVSRAALLTSIAFTFCGCERSPETQAAPDRASARQSLNVLLVTLDTTRADRLGCYGHPSARTPTLDGLAAAGVRFEQAFCQVPLTLPSHASLLTGMYPSAHGVLINDAGALPRDVPVLAESFRRHGYRTGAFIAAFVLDGVFGLDRGFDRYDDDMGAAGAGSAAHVERPGNAVCDAALAWLGEKPNQAFFAWVHLFDPHHPYEPPAEFRGAPADPYDGEIAFADSQIKRLTDWLEQKRLRDNTLVIVVGDHGEAFEEHGEIRHGLFLYETTMHVPLIMTCPSRLPAGSTVPVGVRLIDVVPTVLDLLGWEPWESLDGESLTPTWEAERSDFRPVYGETEYPRLSFGWARLRSLTTERWKYIEAPRPELYDRSADPGEQRNVIGDQPGVAAQMRAALSQMVARMPRRSAQAVTLDAAAIERLASLGYAAGGGAAGDSDDGESRRDPKDMVEVFRRHMDATGMLARKQYAAAAALLEGLIGQSPESDELHALMGVACLGLQRFRDAQHAYEASLRAIPTDPTRLCGLGDAFRLQNETDKAVDCYQRALAVAPDLGTAHRGLGLTYARLGDSARAMEHFQRHVDVSPDNPNAWTNLGNAYLASGRAADAMSALQRAARLDPGFAPVHHSIWQAWWVQGRRSEAVAALREAHRRFPRERALAWRLAWLLATARDATLRNGPEALEIAKACCQAAPNDAASFDVLGAAYASTADFARAVQSAEHALSLAQARGNHALAGQITARLALYRSGTAYRE